MDREYEKLFDIRMTKAEQSAADRIWEYIRANSVSMAVLDPVTSGRKTKAEIIPSSRGKKADPVNAFVVSRRGAVPEKHMNAWAIWDKDKEKSTSTFISVYTPDGDEVLVPTFAIACSPSVGFFDILQNESQAEEVLNVASYSLCKEIDNQCNSTIYYALQHAGKEKKVNSLKDIRKALDGDEYSDIMIGSSFCEELGHELEIKWGFGIALRCPDFVPDKDDQFYIPNAGTVMTKSGKRVRVHVVSKLTEAKAEITFLNGPLDTGKFAISHKPYVVKNRNASKLEVQLVIFILVGFCVFELNGMRYELQ